MICLDSSFIIDFLNGDPKAKEAYMKYSQEEFFVSEISVFEVSTGYLYSYYRRKRSRFDDFVGLISTIKIMPTLNLNSLEAARINASLLYKGRPINSNDCIIAGTMIANGIKKIITKNKRDFSRIEGIEVISY